MTTTPNTSVSPYHHRMPFILRAEQLDAWLGDDWLQVLENPDQAPLEKNPETGRIVLADRQDFSLRKTVADKHHGNFTTLERSAMLINMQDNSFQHQICYFSKSNVKINVKNNQ